MTRRLTPSAQAAKQIRRILKDAYPSVKFSVRSSNYAGGSAVDVSWTDGPTVDQVEALTKQYQSASFDGMQDLKEYTNLRDDIPQADWVQCHRSHSFDAVQEVVEYLNATQDGFALEMDPDPSRKWVTTETSMLRHPNGNGWQTDEIHRVFWSTLFVCRSCHDRTHVGDRYCGQCGVILTPELSLV